MVLSLYGGFGVDKKTNKLLKKETKLEDSLNMTLDDEKNWTKRKGQAIKFPADTKDTVYMNAEGRYFATTSTGYKVFNTDGSEFVPHNFSGLTNVSQMSEGEYMETLLFTHIENPQAVLKYDGGSIYRAGLPAPLREPTTETATSEKFCFFYDYMDAYGNSLFGPLRFFNKEPSSTHIGFTASVFFEGFYSGEIYINSNPTLQKTYTIDKNNRTLNDIYGFSSDIKVGARVSIRDTRNCSGYFDDTYKVIINENLQSSSLGSVSLVIESMTVDSITFTEASFGENSIEFTIPPLTVPFAFGAYPIQNRYVVRFYKKQKENEVYNRLERSDDRFMFFLPEEEDQVFPLTNTFVNNDSTINEIYTVSNSKLRPPRCKYISTFGNQIVYGSVSGLWDFENRFIRYGNDDLIMYSDVSDGGDDVGENISEINRQLIGDTYDGNIGGMCRVKDSLIVFKDKSLYAIDGALLPGEYSLRKIESNLIGCISHKSIITTEQYALFQGNDNIYVTNGFSIKEFGDDISPDIDNSKQMRSAIIVPMEGYVFWNDTKTFFFNYDHNEWFIWDNIDASAGMVIDNEGNPICFNGTDCTKFIPSFNDFGFPIDGKIQLSFLHMKKPGLLKKLTGVRLFNFGTTGNITMSTMKEWKSNIISTATLDYSTNPTSVHKTINPLIGQSISIEFKNNEVDENMLISGMDIEIELDQYKDKNVK